jgi:exopolyphosphatase/pppGpp-phosphohydrolase
MNTPSETTVAPAVDGKEEPRTNLTVPSGKKVTKKPAQKKSRKAVKKVARKKATKPATKKLKRREFPYQTVLKMWNTGKTLETIARATGRYQKNADDPLHGFRVSLTRFHKGVKLNDRLVKLPHRVGKKTLKLATKAGKKASA